MKMLSEEQERFVFCGNALQFQKRLCILRRAFESLNNRVCVHAVRTKFECSLDSQNSKNNLQRIFSSKHIYLCVGVKCLYPRVANCDRNLSDFTISFQNTYLLICKEVGRAVTCNEAQGNQSQSERTRDTCKNSQKLSQHK